MIEVAVEETKWIEKYVDRPTQDVADVKQEMRAVGADLKAEYARSAHRTSATILSALEEMRHMDTQRHANVSSLRGSLDTQTKWIIGLAITTILAIASIAVSVIWAAH